MSCTKCNSTGRFHYPNTGTYDDRPNMIVGHGFTWDICDQCWGSGDENRPFRNLRELCQSRGEAVVITAFNGSTQALVHGMALAGCEIGDKLYTVPRST